MAKQLRDCVDLDFGSSSDNFCRVLLRARAEDPGDVTFHYALREKRALGGDRADLLGLLRRLGRNEAARESRQGAGRRAREPSDAPRLADRTLCETADRPSIFVRCARQDSNLRPLPPQGSALSPELRARGVSVAALCGADLEGGVVGHLHADVGEREAAAALVTRPTAFRRADLRVGIASPSSRARAVRGSLAAVVQARDRLLARVAALREADRALRQAGFGREDAVVDLDARSAACRPRSAELELLGAIGSPSPSRRAPPRLPAVVGVRQRARGCSPKTTSTRAPRARSPPWPRSASAGARVARGRRARARSQQEVVVGPSQHAQRRDHPRLRRQQQRLAVSPGASASTSFETIRWRYSSASGPAKRTNARGRSRATECIAMQLV